MSQPDARQLSFNIEAMCAEVAHQTRECRFCGVKLFIFVRKNGGYVAFDYNAEKHECSVAIARERANSRAAESAVQQ
jgi:hypothetical protein